jgi:hypothetical protein
VEVKKKVITEKKELPKTERVFDNSSQDKNKISKSVTTKHESKKEEISNIDPNLTQEESSLINAIITELGGREFK